MVRHVIGVLTATFMIGMAGGAFAEGATPGGPTQNLSPSSQDNAAARSSTRDTGIGSDDKLNVGPGAKSDAPVPAKTPGPANMSSPD